MAKTSPTECQSKTHKTLVVWISDGRCLVRRGLSESL